VGPTILSQVKFPYPEKMHIPAICTLFVIAGGVLAAVGWMVIVGPVEDLVHFLFAFECIRGV
jgi:hypothetical protein